MKKAKQFFDNDIKTCPECETDLYKTDEAHLYEIFRCPECDEKYVCKGDELITEEIYKDRTIGEDGRLYPNGRDEDDYDEQVKDEEIDFCEECLVYDENLDNDSDIYDESEYDFEDDFEDESWEREE